MACTVNLFVTCYSIALFLYVLSKCFESFEQNVLLWSSCPSGSGRALNFLIVKNAKESFSIFDPAFLYSFRVLDLLFTVQLIFGNFTWSLDAGSKLRKYFW